tara:strand:- start:469 stop:852 length:384 start_codon:yes stop_codon:yes gene_type:complete
MREDKNKLMDKILKNIDTDDLGEVMMDKAESLQMEFGDNIVIFEISIKELKNNNFHKMDKISTIAYGDWNSLRNWVSEDEVGRIKKQFNDDLQYLLEDEESEVEDCSQIYSSFLYCDCQYVWGGMAT